VLEIERTYLVKKIPSNLSSYTSCQIKQGYLSLSSSPLRIRQKGAKFELTKKLPLKADDFSSAEETTISLTESEFNTLWPLVVRSLKKTRYYVSIGGGLTAELDIFQEDLEGLAFVEVEFVSEKQMTLFQPPTWFGRDVTQEEFSANVFLAGKTYVEVKRYLE
jgi:CYTH domain-containing protein